jgi:hypothetical protein
MSSVDQLLREAGAYNLRRHGGRDGVGKRIGGRTYVHRRYAEDVIPAALLHRAEKVAGAYGRGWVCAKYADNGEVTLQHSPDFDTAHEPRVGLCVTISGDGYCVDHRTPTGPLVWHHKWLWVRDDYRGFDVSASIRRSLSWLPLVPAELKCRIGSLAVWQATCRTLRIPL